jgi:hypothetical protein
MINYCHIAPVAYLDKVKSYSTHLLLAHLVEENEEYRNFYINLKKENPNVFYHLDNSAFEKFKRNEPFYESDKLIEMGKLVGADSIVLSDYPKQHWTVTTQAAKRLIPEFKAAGFKTFFCPQSELGDLEGLLKSFEWAINNTAIDFIGVSILACPIALGINETTFGDTGRDEAYRMQRYLSRWRILQLLDRRNLLGEKTLNRFHCLGMTDGPREIELLQPYHDHIFSWDSSSPVFHGINNIKYDSTPTGLRNGKYEAEVHFDMEKVDGSNCIDYNMHVIDCMCLDWK